MTSLPWFRFYNETINDPKFDILSVQLNISKAELIGVWAILLSLASNSPIRGTLMITNKIPYDLSNLPKIFDMERDRLDNILSGFIDMEMLEWEDKHLVVKHWANRQFQSDISTERTKKYRQTVPGTFPNRSQNVSLDRSQNGPDTDTDTESYTESESEQNHNNGNDEIFELFNNNICFLTPMLKDQLIEAEHDYGSSWVKDAIKVAVDNNARNMKYIEAVLRNRKNGKGKPTAITKDRVRVTDEGRKKYGDMP